MAKVVGVVYDANSVTHEELLTVPRIGDMVAKMILERRKELGSLSSLDDIRKLPGMGAGKLEVLGKYLSFDGNGVTPPEVKDEEEVEDIKEELLAGLEEESKSEPEPVEEEKVNTSKKEEEEDSLDDLLNGL